MSPHHSTRAEPLTRSLLPRSSTFVISALALVMVTASARAQTLIGWDGAAVVADTVGPPAPPCGYPGGPILSAFGLAPVPPCPGVAPIGPPGLVTPGGVAYDSALDHVFVSDGFLVERYTAAGAFVDSFTMPLPVFGMGIDSVAGLLWATDGGAFYYAVPLPPGPLCGAPVPVAAGPFPVPLPGPPITGIDWDPIAGVLWIADVGGVVQDVTPTGLPGPFGPYPYAPSACWPAPPPTVRVTVDRGSPFGPGHLYLTDGFTVSSVLPGGVPAPPTFSLPGAPPGSSCFPTAIPMTGIAYTSHGVPYGAGFDPSGLIPPVIGSTGAATSPPSTVAPFTITLSGAVSGAPAFLLMGVGAACPTVPVLGIPLHLSPFGPLFLIGGTLAGPTGAGTLAVPLPFGTAPGAGLYFQWIVATGGSALQVTGGLHFRSSRP